MQSNSGRYVITFNGEIYNYAELRNELNKQIRINWRGASDTEVILEAMEFWGLVNSIKKFIGMFAFALWDRKENKLYLARDRLGKKPLYWGHFNGLFLFGSELKALRAHPGWHPEIDREALATFMRYNYIAAPRSIYRGIYKLPPGSLLTLVPGHKPEVKSYWNLLDIVPAAVRDRKPIPEEEWIRETEDLLEEAVTCRMIADVPLGAFLSGGIDSSTIVALMQKNSGGRVRTFSIGFGEDEFNEAGHAGKIARHLGTDHTEFYVSPEDALAVIPKLPQIYDEPFSDSSQIPTYLVAGLTRRHVTVALSGDGGDEVFAGYNRYLYADKLMQCLNLLPSFAKRSLASIITSVPPDAWNRLSGYLLRRFRMPELGDKLYKLADVLGVEKAETYRKLVSHWQRPEDIVIGAVEPDALTLKDAEIAGIKTVLEQMQLLDTATYLPDDILTKVDRATMAVSLEARTPFLDHRLVEHAWKLPLQMKVRNGQGKWILRRILSKYVPEEFLERPKMGFALPIGAWLRGPLRDWAETLLDRNRIAAQGYLNYAPVKQKWEEHLSGRRNWQYHLWDVLMFQAWLERWM